MIYFDVQTKRKLIDKFYDMLEYGGYLFIGHSESIDRRETRFKYIRPQSTENNSGRLCQQERKYEYWLLMIAYYSERVVQRATSDLNIEVVATG